MKTKKSLACVLSTAFLLSPICHPNVIGINQNIDSTPKSESDAQDSFAEFQKLVDLGFTFRENSNSVENVKLDLFDGDNLDVALKAGLNFILNDEASPYISDKDCITKQINENTLLKECLQSTLNYAERTDLDKKDKNLELLKRLHTLEAIIKSDAGIPADNVAYKFISAMRSSYQMVISRSVAREIFEENKEQIESKMTSQAHSANVGSSATVYKDTFGIGICTDMNTEQSSGETHFYKIDNSGNVGITLGVGLKDYLSADMGCALGITNSLVFYSLDQFLDAQTAQSKVSFIKIKDDDVKKVISSRRHMQDAESEVITKIQTSLEWFLKAADIVPQKMTFKWPEPTMSTSSETKSTFNLQANAGAAASFLASLGMRVSMDRSFTKTKNTHPYIDLIDENCNITDYSKNLDDLIDFLGTAKTLKYQDIQKNMEDYSKTDDTAKQSEILSMIVSNILGDIKRYNSVLSIMADPNSSDKDKKTARETKKAMEQTWIGNTISNKSRKNREAMLKTAISVAAYLRSFAHTDDQIKLFNPLYDEIEHLSMLQQFNNKIFLKHKMGFHTSRKSDCVSASAQTSLNLPIVGATNLGIKYSNSDSPLYTESSEDIVVNTQLPIIDGKIYGIDQLKGKLKEFMEKASEKHTAIATMFADAFDVIDKEFNNMLANHSIEKFVGVPTLISIKNYMNLDFFLTNVPATLSHKNMIPLPNNDLIASNDEKIILKLTKRIDNRATDLGIGAGGANIKSAVRMGNVSSKIGSDTLIFVSNKFNTCALGKETTDTDGLWSKFKQSQKDSLEKLFLNLNNNQSNSKYELQCMYSSIIHNIENKSSMNFHQKRLIKKTVENIFARFLKSCKDLSKAEESQSKKTTYNEAEKLLDSILQLNYEYVWAPALINSNS